MLLVQHNSGMCNTYLVLLVIVEHNCWLILLDAVDCITLMLGRAVSICNRIVLAEDGRANILRIGANNVVCNWFDVIYIHINKW